MVIGTLQVTLQIPNSHSLKEKRHVVRSLSERLRHTFRIAVAEVDHQDTWQLTTIGIAAVSADSRHVDEICQKALNLIQDEGEALVTQSHFELIHL